MIRILLIIVVAAAVFDYFAFDARHVVIAKNYLQQTSREMTHAVTQFMDRRRSP